MKEKKKEKQDTKKIIFAILGILILFCSVLIVGFAIFVFEDTTNHDNSIITGTINDDNKDDDENKGENTGSSGKPINPGSGTISFSYNEASNGVELVNAIPLDDYVGKRLTRSNQVQGVKQGYFDFSIKASGSAKNKIKYQVYATLEDDSDMDTNFIKVYLTDENDTPYKGYNSTIPVFKELDNYGKQGKSKILYSDTIVPKKHTVKKFRLRLWVAKDYSDSSTSKIFKIKVNVKATA